MGDRKIQKSRLESQFPLYQKQLMGDPQFLSCLDNGVHLSLRYGFDMNIKCELCGKDNFKELYRFNNYTIIQCTSCGSGKTLFFNGAQSQKRFEEEKWIETRDILSSYFFEEAKYRYAVLEKFSPGRNLLEIGCGTGEFLLLAKNKGHKVTGIELSTTAVEYIKRKYRDICIIEGTVEDMKLPPQTFDVVVAFHVLEHINNIKEFIIITKELLKPDGLLYLRVPNLNSWYRKILKKSWFGFAPEHTWHFTQRGLTIWLKRNDFEILEVNTFGYEKYSCWPVLPFLFKQAFIMKKVSNFLSPYNNSKKKLYKKNTINVQGLFLSSRKTLKQILLSIYMNYRKIFKFLFMPLIYLSQKTGGGSEICIICKNKK